MGISFKKVDFRFCCSDWVYAYSLSVPLSQKDRYVCNHVHDYRYTVRPSSQMIRRNACGTLNLLNFLRFAWKINFERHDKSFEK